MATCQGMMPKYKNRCGGVVFRCKACGASGCKQAFEGTCTNQKFTNSKCGTCGKMSSAPV